MVNENLGSEYHYNNILGVFLGLLIGGLAGAAAMFLLAPQSGKDTRKQIQKTGIQLRDRATGMMEDAMGQVRSNVSTITAGGRKKVKQLKQQGQKLAVEQLDRVSAAAKAGRTAVKRI
ncbi:MAG TPA: YtxH domain-containing protein [Anaerolineales bacterium]|nr:YtxH domain-containing protein [Anaerolineales bacterium]